MNKLAAAEPCQTVKVQIGQHTFTAELRRWKHDGAYELFLSNDHGSEAWGVNYTREAGDDLVALADDDFEKVVRDILTSKAP